jgi:hypothetical protein
VGSSQNRPPNGFQFFFQKEKKILLSAFCAIAQAEAVPMSRSGATENFFGELTNATKLH